MQRPGAVFPKELRSGLNFFLIFFFFVDYGTAIRLDYVNYRIIVREYGCRKRGIWEMKCSLFEALIIGL